MRKLITILLLLICVGAQAQTFPSTDSLRNFINRYIRNSAIESFTNMRLNTALRGVLNIIDSIETGGGGSDTGMIADSRLSSNIPRKDEYNVYTAGGKFYTDAFDNAPVEIGGVPHVDKPGRLTLRDWTFSTLDAGSMIMDNAYLSGSQFATTRSNGHSSILYLGKSGMELRSSMGSHNAGYEYGYEGDEKYLLSVYPNYTRFYNLRGGGNNRFVRADSQGNITADSLQVSDVTGLGNALAAKADTSSLNNKADLVGGKVPTSQIPALAITEFLGSVASEEEMLELTGQPGDWCSRSDNERNYMLINDGGSELTDWRIIGMPSSPVESVNGQTGVIVLGPDDIGLDNVANVDQTNASNLTSGTVDDARLSGNVARRDGNSKVVSDTVALGITTPSYPFQVYANTNALWTAANFRNASTGAAAMTRFHFHNNVGVGASRGAHVSLAGSNYTQSPNALIFWNYENGPIRFGTNSAEALRLFANGNFRVGSWPATDNGSLLQVAGDIHATGKLIAPNLPASSTSTDSAMAVNRATGEMEMRPIRTTAQDIEITDNTKGIILKSPDGTRFRIKVEDNGTLITEEL